MGRGMRVPAQGTRCDLLITIATVITMDAGRRVLAKGAVAVTGRRISAVGPERSILPKYRARRTIDAGGGVVHPGFIDPHVHVVHGTCRGIFGDALGEAPRTVNFADWKADVRPREECAAAVFAGLEMLHNGFTCFIEPGTVFDCDAVAAATEQVGLRGLLAGTYVWDQIEIMKQLGPLDSALLYGRAPPKLERCLDEMGKQLWRNADPDALVRGFVMIYGTGTASDELERAAHALAKSAGPPFLAAGNARTPIGPEDILEMQTVRAAHVAGLAHEIGSLEPGKRADIVIRSPLAPEVQPAVNPVHQLALLSSASSVDTVIVDGRIVLRNGRSTRVDEAEAYATVKQTVKRRMRRLGLSPSVSWPVVR